MTDGTVLRLADVVPVPGPDAAIAARTCAAIAHLAPAAPLVIEAVGEQALLLPAVALSQRSLHRAVVGYVLVNPVLPPVTDGWPDAPVTVVTDDSGSDASLQGRLRGWRVLTSTQYAAEQDTAR